jgi:hypothetical protein
MDTVKASEILDFNSEFTLLFTRGIYITEILGLRSAPIILLVGYFTTLLVSRL